MAAWTLMFIFMVVIIIIILYFVNICQFINYNIINIKLVFPINPLAARHPPPLFSLFSLPYVHIAVLED